MDPYQDLLFGQAPRRVGTPNQHWVYAAEQVGFFIDRVNGEHNAYATVGWWDFDDEATVCDKVLYDLDSTAKAEPHEVGDWAIYDGPKESEPPDDEVIAAMRDDPDLAEEILGDVCRDAQAIARRSRNDNVPIVGVFSGFGLHIHQLFEPTVHPDAAMESTARRYVDETDAETVDEILGEPDRLCRIPNCERIEDGRGCGLYTVPLTGAELAAVTPEWLLDVSRTPRQPSAPDVAERPEMPVWEQYVSPEPVQLAPDEAAEPKPLDEDHETDDEDLRWLVGQLLPLPCMQRYLLDDPNPDHKIRMNATVMLLNAGLSPQTVINLFSMIRWVDWDRSETRKQVMNIYQNGYSDMACRRLRADGYCVHDDAPKECETHGWTGGNLRYQ